tara:strand:- start:39 stop:977 length:939 start_codon:yes stop_codon:yes gene_type:complete
MKITKTQLKQMIEQELSDMSEAWTSDGKWKSRFNTPPPPPSEEAESLEDRRKRREREERERRRGGNRSKYFEEEIQEENIELDEGFLDTIKGAIGMGGEEEAPAAAKPSGREIVLNRAKKACAHAKPDGSPTNTERRYKKCLIRHLRKQTADNRAASAAAAEEERQAAAVQRDVDRTSGCNCNTLHRPGTKCGKICAKRLGVDPNAPLSPEERKRIRDIRDQTDQAIAQKNRAAYDQEQADRQRVADEIDAKNREDQKRRDDLRRKRNPYNRRRPSRGTSFGGGGMGESINKDDLYGIIEEELSAFLAEMKD